ncbi:MAG: hypothetical protein KDK70_38145 [Myxococcales bacterium]|nr:hypothetical protein [Myxococcales bacterium]
MMRIGVLINDFSSLGPRQSTAMLALALHLEGHDVRVFSVADLGMDPDGMVIARARRARRAPDVPSLVAEVAQDPGEQGPLTAFDFVLSRTNPARDERQGLQACALQLLEIATHQGLVVLNDPAGLTRAASKAYLGLLPDFTRPRTITSADRETLRRFVLELEGPAVLKPALGTRGVGVFRAERSERNLNQILDLLLERGMVTAQEFIPQADQGDTRVLVVGGEVLRVEGEPAAVRRVPGHDDFRSNIHAGGQPAPGTLTPAMERVVEAVGPRLLHDGFFVVGLDFIGDVLCEANVHSPGGLKDIERFSGRPFARHLARALVAEAERVRVERAGEPGAASAAAADERRSAP